MTLAVQALITELQRLGYQGDRLVHSYEFSDVRSANAATCRVDVAAFTHDPPSYRSAAFGVIEGRRPDDADMDWASSLGAPVLFVVEGDDITAMKVQASGAPVRLGKVSSSNIHSFFDRHKQDWTPQALRRLKLIGVSQAELLQYDFFDALLLPTIEAETHKHLDKLLQTVVSDVRGRASVLSTSMLAIVFQLLAAKILVDRRHPVANSWGIDWRAVLDGINDYYELESNSYGGISDTAAASASIEVAWRALTNSLNLRNVSSDDLAYVYENTFVTQDTRRAFGTHSTPRAVTEYVCDRLPFDDIDMGSINVFEPFTGAGMFLISALRRLSNRLGDEYTAEQRHDYLVNRLNGVECDAFARQVARLSLILADYPNKNGWKVELGDLFLDTDHFSRIDQNTVVFCNPPYEAFNPPERAKYEQTIGEHSSKPIWAITQILKHKPAAFGFVLPGDFALEKRYAGVRRTIDTMYRDIEVLRLPEGVFSKSTIETCVVIGKHRRHVEADDRSFITSTLVHKRDKDAFLERRSVTSQRSMERSTERQNLGNLWVNELASVWALLKDAPKLGAILELHRGLEWISGLQERAWSRTEFPISQLGFMSPENMAAFELPQPVYLDVNPDHLRGGAIKYDWRASKVVFNAMRRSRGPWKAAAAVDRHGLLASQQFIAGWLRETSPYSLEVVAAILNSPVANAFFATHSFGKGIRIATADTLPIPQNLDAKSIEEMVLEFEEVASQFMFDIKKSDALRSLMLQIDAAILEGYDLPPREERRLLEYFRGFRRLTSFEFDEWYPADLAVALPLREIVDGVPKRATDRSLFDMFKKLPIEETEAVFKFIK